MGYRKPLKRANGTGSVYKNTGRRRKPWVAVRNKVLIGSFTTKAEALEALGRLVDRDITDKYNMTFADVFQAWREEHYKDLTAAGKETYNRSFAVFSQLHKAKFRTLRTADFQEVIDQHFQKTHSTVSKYKQLITQMSKWAIREEIITTNFASFVRIPSEKKKEKDIFTREEIALLEADGTETAQIVLMLLYTGMRIGELFSLPVTDYHETYVVGGEKTETGRNRVIPIRPEGRPLFAHFAETATGPLLLSGYTGNHKIDNFRKRDYYPLLDRLSIPRRTPHATRHTYASEARAAGMPPEILQEILGHANYSTTANIYVHTEVTQLVNVVETVFVSNLLATESGGRQRGTD